MLVAGASGLDGALKKLIRDALPTLIVKYDSVHSAFEKFTQKRLQVGEVDATSGVSPKVLAKILAAPDPRAQLVEDYVYELTGDSLQSTEQLFKTCAALGADGLDRDRRCKDPSRKYSMRGTRSSTNST